MKRIYNTVIGGAAMLSAVLFLNSCDEFTPVFTGNYPEPESWETQELVVTHTIGELAAMYKVEQPFEITDDIVIAGKVVTSDQSGNFYRSLYIQDETGGIELKLGKTGLYNEYKLGQTVYVKCKGLWLGMYGYKTPGEYKGEPTGGSGMVQLGLEDPTEEYETSYIEVQYLIDQHIFRGAEGEPLAPVTVSESALPGREDTQATNEYIGKYITLNNLTYTGEIFTLLYINSAQMDTDESANRVFLSTDAGEEPKDYGITTWAMSEQNVKAHLRAGDWDGCSVGNGNDADNGVYGTVADHKEEMLRYATPANVSQYFEMPEGTEVQVRTSGYSRFADLEIPEEVRNGDKTIDVTGILTMYQGSIQFVLLDQNGIVVNE